MRDKETERISDEGNALAIVFPFSEIGEKNAEIFIYIFFPLGQYIYHALIMSLPGVVAVAAGRRVRAEPDNPLGAGPLVTTHPYTTTRTTVTSSHLFADFW
mgnify:CR=1 FL=1